MNVSKHSDVHFNACDESSSVKKDYFQRFSTDLRIVAVFFGLVKQPWMFVCVAMIGANSLSELELNGIIY